VFSIEYPIFMAQQPPLAEERERPMLLAGCSLR